MAAKITNASKRIKHNNIVFAIGILTLFAFIFYRNFMNLSSLQILYFYLMIIVFGISFLISIKKDLIYNMLIFLTEIFCIIFFSTKNILTLYIAFEGSLIPLFLIIFLYGSKERFFASFKLFIYTYIASIPMLVGILYLVFFENIKTIGDMIILSHTKQIYLFIAFMTSIFVKTPIMPFHSWLYHAHVEAPTAGSCILAGIILKMGVYFIITIILPYFNYAYIYFANFIIMIAILSTIASGIIAFYQNDIKRIIAYSSISHMGFIIIGLFIPYKTSLNGAIIGIFSHGIISTFMFSIAGILYNIFKTRNIENINGIKKSLPKLGLLLLIGSLSMMAFPPLISFTAEIMIIIGLVQKNIVFGSILVLSSVISCIYALNIYNKIVLIKSVKTIPKTSDIDYKSHFYLYFIVLSMFAIGIYPNIILDKIFPITNNLQKMYKKNKVT